MQIMIFRPASDKVRGFFGSYSQPKHLLILLIAAFVAYEAVMFFYHFFPLVQGESDGVGYMHRSFGNFFRLDPYHGPGYSWAILFVRFFGIDPFSAAKLVSMFFAIIFLIAIYKIVSSISTSNHGVAAAYLAALNPNFLIRSVSILSDFMALGCGYSVLAILFRKKGITKKQAFLVGMLAGVAYLTRYVYILILIVPVLMWLFRAYGEETRRQTFGKMALVFAGFIVMTLPWFIFVYMDKKNPFYNLNYLLVAFRMHNQGQRLNLNYVPSPEEYGSLLEVYRSNPKLFFQSWLMDFKALPAAIWKFSPQVCAIAGVGALAWLFSFNKRKFILLILNAIYVFLICWVWPFPRLYLFMLPLIASIAVSGIFLLPRVVVFPLPSRVARVIPVLPVRSIAMLVLLTLMTITAIPRIKLFYSNHPVEYKEAAEWLQTVTTDSTVVLAAKRHIPFYARTKFVQFRDCGFQYAGIQDLPRLLDNINPNYLIFDERYAGKQFPRLGGLAKQMSHPHAALLEKVFEVQEPQRLVIYRYKRKKP
jgi:hypothetical protein